MQGKRREVQGNRYTTARLQGIRIELHRTSIRAAIKLDLSINIGERSAKSQGVYVPWKGASVPSKGSGRFHHGVRDEFRDRRDRLGVAFPSPQPRCAFRLL